VKRQNVEEEERRGKEWQCHELVRLSRVMGPRYHKVHGKFPGSTLETMFGYFEMEPRMWTTHALVCKTRGPGFYAKWLRPLDSGKKKNVSRIQLNLASTL
jgi:hypothetical protein